MASQQASTLDQFSSLFRGHEGSWVKHTPPFELKSKTEDGPQKMTAVNVSIAEYRNNSKYHPAPPEGYEHEDRIPVNRSVYQDHLNGVLGAAISPLIKSKDGEDVCFYSIIDIDVYQDAKGDPVYYTDLIKRLYEFGYKFAAFESKSGGLHIYFFFKDAEPAKRAKAAMDKIVEVFGLGKAYVSDKGRSKVETFPEHVTRNPGQDDKHVFLPFFGSKPDPDEAMTQMISAQGELINVKDAMPLLEKMMTQIKDVEKVTESLPYGEAPYCVQQLLINGSLGEHSGRNEFMFTAALYLKAKGGPNFQKDELIEMNNRLPFPLEDHEIDGIFSSATTKDYQLMGRCKKEPCSSVCDKQLCKLRQYGVGKEKGNTTRNIEFGTIHRYRGEEAYYLWEARVAGTDDEFKLLRIDGAENLLNQKPIQRACIDALGQTMITTKQASWEGDLNEYLKNMEEHEVTKATDTTDFGGLRNLFERFLTHRQNRVKQPYTVAVRQVYFDDGVYYFTTDAFREYLNIMKFSYIKINLREQLIKYGCAETKLTYPAQGVEKVIECWGKPSDEVLSTMTTFYDDIMSADMAVIADNKLNKKDAYDNESSSAQMEEESLF